MEGSKNAQPFLLRLPKSQKEQATALAAEEGVSLNHFISFAIAQHIVSLEQAREIRKAAQERRTKPTVPAHRTA